MRGVFGYMMTVLVIFIVLAVLYPYFWQATDLILAGTTDPIVKVGVSLIPVAIAVATIISWVRMPSTMQKL